jgi:hypothetical protein
VIDGAVGFARDSTKLDPERIRAGVRFLMDSSKAMQDIVVSRFSLDFRDEAES